MTTMAKVNVILKTKEKLAEIAKKNSQANLKQNQSNTDSLNSVNRLGRQGVNGKIGERAGVGHDTVRKIERILKEAPEHIRDRAMKGQISINKAYRKLENEQKRQKLINAKPVIELPENAKPLLGDMSERGKEIPDNSIDLGLTDPPYAVKNLHLYEKLGALAFRVLKPGGSLVVIANYDLLQCAKLIEKSGLKCIHDFAIIHEGHCGVDWKYHIELDHKTALWFVKGDKPNTIGVIQYVIYSTKPDKSLDEWAQSPKEADHIIRGLTVENQIVLDPFMGTGTWGIAALKLRRQFIGIDINPDKVKIAKRNIAKVLNGQS